MTEITLNDGLNGNLGTTTENHEIERVIGESPAMREAKLRLAEVARSGCATVLLRGETGTGRDLAARVIHYNSDRAAHPFVAIGCASLPERLLEAELFGRRFARADGEPTRGMLELADQGTVFLDEVAGMSLAMQARLLRFLEDSCVRRDDDSPGRTVNVRIIAATAGDLERAVREGHFNEELYRRLQVLPVDLPALRARRGDVRLLVSHFITTFNREFRTEVRDVSPEVLKVLEGHSWPGNVRELKNAIEHAMLVSQGSVLELSSFPGFAEPAEESQFRLPATGLNLRDLERRLVIQALERTQGNRTRAARLLGLNRDQMRYRVAKFGLKERRFVNGATETVVAEQTL